MYESVAKLPSGEVTGNRNTSVGRLSKKLIMSFKNATLFIFTDKLMIFFEILVYIWYIFDNIFWYIFGI